MDDKRSRNKTIINEETGTLAEDHIDKNAEDTDYSPEESSNPDFGLIQKKKEIEHILFEEKRADIPIIRDGFEPIDINCVALDDKEAIQLGYFTKRF